MRDDSALASQQVRSSYRRRQRFNFGGHQDSLQEIAAEEAEDCLILRLNIFILLIVSIRNVTSHEALAELGVRRF